MGFPSSSTLNQFYEQFLGKTPGTEYNTFGVIASAAPSAVVGVDAMIKSNQAKKQLKTQQGYVDTLMQSYMSKPIYNPYKNMSVATKAAQMKVEETDKALANTLDTLRATGTSAGGATALAQAALQSKLGIAADIETQEVNNQKLEAKGELMVQQAEFSRMGEQMDYEQSKADQLRTEQFNYGERAADMAGALGALGLEASRGLSTKKDKPEGEVGDALTPSAPPQTYLDDEGYLQGPGDEDKLTMDTIPQNDDDFRAFLPSDDPNNQSTTAGSPLNDPDLDADVNALLAPGIETRPTQEDIADLSTGIPQTQVVPDLNYTGSWSDIKEIKKIRDSVAKGSPEYEDAQKKINQWYYKKDPVKYSYLKNKI
jgi:hypothetical protein